MGKRIQIQELIAISKTGEVLQSSVKELREQAWHVRGGKTEENRVERMATHIANLANEARIAHTKRGSSPESVLVTRLILNEFSLYTKDSPLNLSEYKLLIKKIHGITSTLPPDIHLLLATVPVLWSDNSVHNCALYTQSPLIAGGRPIIHHFSKEHASPVDFRYIDETTGGGFPLRGDAVGDHSPRVVLGDTEVNTGDFNQFGSAIKIVTSVGEAFITLIDICLDHRMRVAENNLINLITVLKKLGQLIPLYMSQVISSHSIPPIKKHLFVPLTQSDESCKRADGAKPEEEVHLPSSFGGFVDITKFPPIYLDIPYRKRILRHLSTAVAGEAILQETITNPGDLAYLYKRVNALAKMGVPLGPEARVISELEFLQDDLFMPSTSSTTINTTPTAVMSSKEEEEEPFEPELSLGTFVESAITEALISDQSTISPKKWTDLLFEIPMGEEGEEDLFNPALNVGVFVNSAGIKTPASEQDTAVSEEWRDFLFEIPMDEEEKGDPFNSEPNVGSMVDSASIETSTSEQDMMAPEKWIDQLLEEAAMTGEEEEELLPFMSTGPSAFVEQSSVGDNLFSFFSPLETKEHAVSKRDSVKSITRNVATMEEFSSKFKTSHKETKQREIEDRRYRLC